MGEGVRELKEKTSDNDDGVEKTDSGGQCSTLLGSHKKKKKVRKLRQ